VAQKSRAPRPIGLRMIARTGSFMLTTHVIMTFRTQETNEGLDVDHGRLFFCNLLALASSPRSRLGCPVCHRPLYGVVAQHCCLRKADPGDHRRRCPSATCRSGTTALFAALYDHGYEG